MKKHQQSTPTIITTAIPTHSSKSDLVLWRKSANKFNSANKKSFQIFWWIDYSKTPTATMLYPVSRREQKLQKNSHTKKFLQIRTSSDWERHRHTHTDPPQIPEREREREREKRGFGNWYFVVVLGQEEREIRGKRNKRSLLWRQEEQEQEQIVSFKWDCGYSTWRSMSPSTELITRTKWTAWSMCYASGPFCFPACSCWPTPSSWCRSCHGCPAAYNYPPPSPSSSSTASWCSTTASWLR